MEMKSDLENEQEPYRDIDDTSPRFLLLFLACILCFGFYFVRDNPAPMEVEISKELSIDSVKFNMLFSVYFFPNIILPLLGGLLMDKFGSKRIIYTAASLILLGQGIFTLGIYNRSLVISLIGRGIFGCGGDNLDIAQSIVIVKWFKKKELSMAFGINSSISLASVFLSDIIEPFIIKYSGSVSFAALFGFMICIISLSSAFYLNKLDKVHDEQISAHTKEKEAENFELRKLNGLSGLYWILLVNCLFVETSIFCFNFITSGYFQLRFGYTAVETGSIMSIGFGIPAICCPIVGKIVDKIGRRIQLIIFSNLMILFSQLALSMTPNTEKGLIPILYLTLIGLAYSIYLTVYWSCIPFVVQENMIGTAYGLNYSVLAAGFCIFPVVVGTIIDNTQSLGGYYWVNIFLAGTATVGVFAALIAYAIDKQNGSSLQSASPSYTYGKILDTSSNEGIELSTVEANI